ncbi:cytochrome c3 family protein [Candidatus Latescibacterota bacterium]
MISFKKKSNHVTPLIIFTVIVIAGSIGIYLTSAEAVTTLHGEIDISCNDCHRTEDPTALRKDLEFNHDETEFPLTGTHRILSCNECHSELIFPGIKSTCADCHDDVHNRAHGIDCARCHTTSTFTISDDHSGFHESTRFPLRGMHRTLSCNACHEGTTGEWQGLDTSCVSCHYNDYRSAKSIDHFVAGFGTDCIRCHSETSGFNVLFDHNTTGAELTGAHVFLECVECHNGDFIETLPNECSACHLGDYKSTTAPAHEAAEFPTSCDKCHVTTAWIPADYSIGHTIYPLNGVHATLACSECHSDGYTSTLPTTCVGCHENDYLSAADPVHERIFLPLSCEACHTENSWSPSTYDHSDTGFLLTESHASIGCNACHTSSDGRYPPAECYLCHSAEYNSAPDHVSFGYGSNCIECHNQSVWEDATFEHDSFPIYSGAHRSEWSSCNECHTDSAHLTEFSCIVCHNQNLMASEHRNENGYIFQSQACYNCHPDGETEDDDD